MKENIRIFQISGDDPALYPIVGPYVMDANILKANNNYPFKTSHRHLWFIAQDTEENVLGFTPLELRKDYWLLNNYYVSDPKVLKALIKAMPSDRPIEVVALQRDREIFADAHFDVKLEMIKYVKMICGSKPKKESKDGTGGHTKKSAGKK